LRCAQDDDGEDGKSCVVKVIMTGSADDGPGWQPHIRNKEKRRKLANRFKDSKDSFRIAGDALIGFDALRRQTSIPTSRCKAADRKAAG